MQNIINLLKLQIDNNTNLLKVSSPSKMAKSIIKHIVILLLITVVVGVLLFRIFLYGIIVNRELIAIVLLVTQIISFAFATGNIIKTLFLSNDNSLFMCLPVSANQLFISKMLLIYLKELYVNMLITIPLFFSLGFLGGYGISYYLSILLFVLILPLLPILLASLISIPIMQLIKFLKSHTTIAIITILVVVCVCLWFYISIISGVVNGINIAEDQTESFRQINNTIKIIGANIPIYFSLASAMISFSGWGNILLFVAICAFLLLLAIQLIKPFYLKVAMYSLENTSKQTQKTCNFKQDRPFVSLIKKEAKCVFRSSSEVFECFLFTLLMPFIVFTYDKLLVSISVNQAGVNMIAGSHVMVVAILAMLSNIISASAISREGGNFYISKIIPVNYYSQVFAKLTFNAIFTIGALVLTMFVSFFIYPVWQVLLSTIAIMFLSIGHIAFNLDMDIKNPTMSFGGDGKNGTTSKTTPKSIVWGLILGFVSGLIIILMSSSANAVLPYLLLILGSFIFMLYRIYILVLRINLAYDKIEM